jgi:hypothetical protein
LSDQIKVQLAKPFRTADGKSQDYVMMRPLLTVGTFRRANRAASGNPIDRQFHVLTELCGLTEQELDGLSMDDFTKLGDLVDSGAPDEDEAPAGDPKE